MSTTRPRFRESALASGLVSEEQIRTALGQILQTNKSRVLSSDISDKELAAKLIEMGVVTPYQADQMLSGKSRLSLGPYIITDWIGQGGMGQVFKAVHQMLGRECAVKVLPINKTTPEAIEHFRREIRTQAKLDHPNLVRAYDAGVDGNVHYLVVEYVPGFDLRRLVRSKGKLSLHQAASLIKQAAEGLAHAHARGLIHRDIKPGNILVTPEGVSKLSDLGLAYCFEEGKDPRAGKIVGTADYLSPEQIKAPSDVSEASDIYSLGCTLYYAITSKVPFPGGTTRTKAKRHLDETPWHPRRFNDEVSDEFVDLIGDMMEKNPAERIQSALEVAERLSPWARSESLQLRSTDERSRWMAAPVPSGDQDTDPNDAAEIAGNDLSGASETSQGSFAGQQTEALQRSSVTPSLPPDAAVPISVVKQFKQARRLDNDPILVSLGTTILMTVIFGAIGVLIGFVLGYWFPRT
jgi:serine/threonine protein kinase